jgi:hypothetical protein
MLKNEQPNKICKWNTPLIRCAAQIVGAVTKIYLKELHSVYILSDSPEYLLIWYMYSPVGPTLEQFTVPTNRSTCLWLTVNCTLSSGLRVGMKWFVLLLRIQAGTSSVLSPEDDDG